MTTRALAIALSSALLLGCQTARSIEGGCPGIYAGMRFVADQWGELPWDGRIFFLIDVPFSAVADTLALPATAFMEPSKPEGGYAPGCHWAR